ncbi:VanW family protein [Cohnella sp.]|uniref:VanW family protein n=1 Tax=Cohnella sp. TaxID=1883426 RepID=UPI00356A10BA
MNWFSIAGILLLLHQDDVSDRLLVNHQGKTAIIVNRSDYALPALPLMDMDKFDHLLHDLDREIYQGPQNARFGDDGKIIPEQIGFKLDRTRFTDQFQTFFFSNGNNTIEAARKPIYPRVDSELIAHLREKTIGHYVTYFNSRNKNRAHNITLAAKAINNAVLFPGEIFSFNQAVGKRTKEKGYLRASVIVKGELSEGIGGGICQVSSTLFNAVDRAGLQILQRYSHSRSVPYVLPGRDATVSWDGPDFSFQNKYNQPILIRVYSGGGRMFVTIYSSDMIEHKPRIVHGTSKQLPEEIFIETRKKTLR